MKLFTRQTAPPHSSADPESLESMVGQMAEKIVAFAHSLDPDHPTKLDYSIDSLTALDALLGETPVASLEDGLVTALAAQAGCYIFEVARRTYGGTYYMDARTEQPLMIISEPDFSVSFLAIEKATGRLKNGDEDNIPFYFDGIVAAVAKKQSAMII